MGLPMFREPDENAADQAISKLEQIVATRRSAIRRESTVRPHRHSSSRTLRRHIQEIGRTHDSHNAALPLDEEGERRLEGLRSRRVEDRRLRREALDETVSSQTRVSDYGEPIHSDNERRNDLDVQLLNRLRENVDALPEANTSEYDMDIFGIDSEETGSRRLPRPSSNLRFELEGTQNPGRHLLRQQPDFASASIGAPRTRRSLASIARPWAVSHGASVDGETEVNDLGSPRLTQGFAPANGPYRVSDLERTRSSVNLSMGLLDDPIPEGLDRSYPPLRRVDHFSPRRTHSPRRSERSRLDGLGDRLRSPSPGSDANAEENWGNLTTTMEPRRSTASSSFISISRSLSERSSQPTTAATSFGEIGGDDTCDLDLPSGITEDDVREIRARHGRLRSENAPTSMDGPQLDDAPPRRRPNGMMEMEVFGIILERLQQREEVPDAWWAAVGLSPDVVRGSAS